MKHLIFALGNPGEQYNFTRHNFGFLALDFFARTHSLTFTPSKKFSAEIAHYNISAAHLDEVQGKPEQRSETYSDIRRASSGGLDEEIRQMRDTDALLVKPTSFYNLTGIPLSAIINFYKIPLENVLVVCDDFTLPLGTLRYRSSGSAGGSNGLKSIIEHLKTDEFPRLRLGTDSPMRATLGDTAFVLAKFTPEEKAQLPGILTEINQKITDFIG